VQRLGFNLFIALANGRYQKYKYLRSMLYGI
jgi:hypothetical protein